jgi:parvulin-like peptidyl-prolyl isomerase
LLRTAALLWLATAAAPGPADVLARVDDVAITRADVEERIRVLGPRRALTPADVVPDLVDEALLAADARRQGLDRDAAVAEDLSAQRRRLAAEAYIASLGESIKPTEAQLRAMYHSSGDQVRLTVAKFLTEAEAAAAAERVRKGGDLAAEARHSPDPNLAATGGDTGLLSRVMVDPALVEPAFKEPVGALVGPVKLELGFALFRVVERTLADEAGFASRREALVEMARTRGVQQARSHLVEQLRKSSGVTLDEKFLDSLGTRTELTPAELAHPFAVVNGRPVPYAAIHPQVVELFRVARGHGAGPAARQRIAWQEVEARLLADSAVAKGFDRAPSVQAVLPGIERNVLAAVVASKLSATADPRDPAVRARIDALRRQAKVQIDRERVAAQRPR